MLSFNFYHIDDNLIMNLTLENKPSLIYTYVYVVYYRDKN